MSLPDRHLGDRVAALVDGRLPSDERSALLGHLARCPKCRAQYDEQAAIKGVLSDLRRRDAPDGLASRLAGLAVPPSPVSPVSPVLPMSQGLPIASRPEPRPSGRSVSQRARLAGAGLLSVGVVGLGASYLAGGAPVGAAVVPPIDRFQREHSQLAGGVPLSEPVLVQLPPVSPLLNQPSYIVPAVRRFGGPGLSSAPRGAAPRASDPAAVALLRRALAVESTVAYTGTQVIRTRGATDRMVDVTHFPGHGAMLAVSGGTDPAGAVFEGDSARWNAVSLDLISARYSLLSSADATVAGRAAKVVWAVRADGSRAASFWLDAESGLLLRRDRFDRNGDRLRSMEFTSLRFSAATPSHLPPMMPLNVSVLNANSAGAWAARGWPCPKSLGGLGLVSATPLTGGGASVLHLSYSDGLTLVSVFVQSGHLDDAALPASSPANVGGHAVRSAPSSTGGQQVFWAAKGWVFTVVSDVPELGIDDLVADLPHDSGDVDQPDAADRVGRGADRLASWLNPLD